MFFADENMWNYHIWTHMSYAFKRATLEFLNGSEQH